MTSVLTGVSRVTKNKSPKLDLTTGIFLSPSSEPGVPTIQAVSEEVIKFNFLMGNHF